MDFKRRVRTLFGRRVGTHLTQKAGEWFTVGEVTGTPTYSGDVAMKSIALPDDVLPGAQKGIDRLVSQSKLRLATDAEVDAWIQGAANAKQTPVDQFRRDMDWRLTKGQVYVVLTPFDLPESMGGANARSFILPAGTAMPGGPKGHNTFLVMSGFACEGVGCP